MVARSKCLYDNEMIGIETIYTVIDGKQINKENEVERIRELGRKKKLFCPCGCGVNLILVAGEKNLVRQHFRQFSDSEEIEKNCTWKEESELSINSKIALKCWMEKELALESKDIKYAQRVNKINKKDKKFELSLYCEKYDFGILYCKSKQSIYDGRLDYIDKFLDTKILYVADAGNKTENGQYPEFMKKMQNKQGYCVFLSFGEEETYDNAYMNVVYYRKNQSGKWIAHDIGFGKMEDFSLNENRDFLYKGKDVDSMINQKNNSLEAAEEQERKRLEEQERIRKEEARRAEEEYQEYLRKKEQLKKEAEEKRKRISEEKKTQAAAAKISNSYGQAMIQNKNLMIRSTDINPKIIQTGNILISSYPVAECGFTMMNGRGKLIDAKMTINIGMIECYAEGICITDKYTGQRYMVFINTKPADQDKFAKGDIPYCNMSMRYSDMEDIPELVHKMFAVG